MADCGEIGKLQAEIARFCEERDWGKFHNGKDLAIAISVEASELLEPFLWKSPEEVNRSKVEEELADVLIYALRMAERLGLDVGEIVSRKLARNAEKYPVSKCRGSAEKYTQLQSRG